jgi:hypothetical protein
VRLWPVNSGVGSGWVDLAFGLYRLCGGVMCGSSLLRCQSVEGSGYDDWMLVGLRSMVHGSARLRGGRRRPWSAGWVALAIGRGVAA